MDWVRPEVRDDAVESIVSLVSASPQKSGHKSLYVQPSSPHQLKPVPNEASEHRLVEAGPYRKKQTKYSLIKSLRIRIYRI